MTTWMDHTNLAGLEHLVLDRDATMIGPESTALFSPCRRGHRPGECQIADGDGEYPPCREYRYALTRQWTPANPPAVFIMLNPSTANAFKLDPTVSRCLGFADKWGCGGLIVLNAFALRSTDPKLLRAFPDPIGEHNDDVIARVLSAGTVGPVVVGWGADTHMARSGRGHRLVQLLHAGGIEPVCLAKTKGGHPQHPLYLPTMSLRIPYPNADAYADAMNRAAADG